MGKAFRIVLRGFGWVIRSGFALLIAVNIIGIFNGIGEFAIARS